MAEMISLLRDLMFSRISVGAYGITLCGMLLFLWFAGAVCRGLFHAGGYLRFVHKIGRCPGYFQHDTEKVIGRVNREYGKTGKFAVLLVPGIQAPAIFGLMRPRILMPATEYTEEEVYFIVKHEMLHYYQHDMWRKLLCEFLCTAFWWNPGALFLKKRIIKKLEMRVDRLLISGFDEEEKIRYLECIVKSMRAGKQETGLLAAIAAQDEEFIMQRFYSMWESRLEGRGRYLIIRGGKRMKKQLALKTLLRSPLKTALTFLLIAAASFALFSRVTDYAVTMRETKNAKSLYHAVASLNNVVPDVEVITKLVHSADYYANDGYGKTYDMPDKPCPTEEELEEFASLPGVTLADTQYMTTGLAEGYDRLMAYGEVLFEGTYQGYLDDTDPSIMENHVSLAFDNVKVIAGDRDLKIGRSFEMEQAPLGEMYYAPSDCTRAFYDSLKKGSRCLVYAYISDPASRESGMFFNYKEGTDALRVIDGLPQNYLETKDFVRQKGWAEAIKYNAATYDIVYTSDMRALPEMNNQRMEMVQGRSLAAEDTDACVVSGYFLEENGLAVGDSIRVYLSDRLCHGMTKASEGKDVPEFKDPVKLTIVGAYSDDSGTVDTIYLPAGLLPVEVPGDYEVKPSEFNVFVENADDIERFREAAEAFAQKLDLELKFTDKGWLDVKDSFGMGTFTSLLTTLFYIVGAALALFLAVYLYIGQKKTSYAIMRMLGVPARAAGNSVLLPFVSVAALAIPIGGSVGLYYAQRQAGQALARMADSVSLGYVPDATLPVGIVVLCLILELLFVSVCAYSFLRKMKSIPPLALLHEGGRVAKMAGNWAEPLDALEDTAVLAEFDLAKISAAKEWMPKRSYGAVRHTVSYIRRHMRRAVGKTAVSLILAAVLSAGIGTFILARVTYRDAYYELGVKGTARDFILPYAVELSTSSLVKDFYCYDNFGVRMAGEEETAIMTVTNDLVRNMGNEYSVDYAEGYDLSSFEGMAQVCLVGEELADKCHISPGDEISLYSDLLYCALEEDGGLMDSLDYKPYKVIGVARSEDAAVKNSIFTGIKSDVTRLFTGEVPVEHCEFTLADNDRLDEFEKLLQKMEGGSGMYSTFVSYHVDTGGLSNIERIRSLLEVLFPIAVAAAVMIGLIGPLFVVLQSAQEAAFMRILGVTKKRARCMLVFEQAFLAAAGVVLVLGGFFLYDPGRFARDGRTVFICFGLYLLGGICGAASAAIQVTRGRLLELLQVKE